MCSVEIEEFPNNYPVKIGSLCTKCSEKAVVIIRGIDPLCKDCFLAYFIHKFRAVLGKSKLIKSEEKILVAHSGGPSSSAMVHLIYQGVNEQHHKKLRFYPSLVFIDEGAINNFSLDDRRLKCQEVLDLITYTNFTCYVTTLENIFELNECDGDSLNIYVTIAPGSKLTHLPTSIKARDQLQLFLSSVQTLTAKVDIIEKFRHKLLYKIARHVGHNKILVGESATRLAVRLLANMAQGRGAHLPLDTKFLDDRHELLFLRPMKELSSKEIGFYNAFQNVQVIVLQNLLSGTFQSSCIQRLTESFVYSLQSEFFSTVSTIVKTGDKLCLENKLDKNKEMCLLCHAPLDTDTSSSSSLVATQLSQMLSQSKYKNSSNFKDNLLESQIFSNKDSLDMDDDDDEDSAALSSIGLTKDQLNQHLCYGCRIIIRDMGTIDPLPMFIQQQATEKIQSIPLKEHIQEFLLDDSESCI